MIVKVFLPHSFKTEYKADLIVGVDYGAYQLAKQEIMMDIAIGDFDSTDDTQFQQIEKYSKKVIKLDIVKDETDSEAAVIYLKDLGYERITLVGDLGNRFDHMLINYRLCEKYDITYILEDSKIFNLSDGLCRINKDYQFLSLFTSNGVTLNLSGTKYELSNRRIDYLDTYTSANEIVEDSATIEVLDGSVTVVLSNDQ